MMREGDLLAGKYRVERLLGEGGMGYVVAAIHEQLHQKVAVKFLAPALCENQDAAHRFLREARAAVRIQSEHVARVLDVGELEGGAPYMVMEFLDGNDLAREIQARGRFEIATAIDYVLQASEAVAEAHSVGLIHRDLKPANLFLTRRPDGSPLVKVLDFGISKAVSPDTSSKDHPSLTAAQSLLGSPAYMSPEQARRPKTVDTRTDVWSFGVILYEFLTGTTPWRGDHPLELLTASVSDPMPSLTELRPDVPRELEAVIEKCLAKRPEDRHQTVADLAQALAPFAPSSSMPSISRISGILRTNPDKDSTSTTLKSFPIENASADTELMPSGSNPSGPAGTPVKDTQAGWGTSQALASRSRFRIVLAAGAAILLVALAIFLIAPGAPKGTSHVGVDAATATPAAATPAPAAPAAEGHDTARAEPSPAVVVAPHDEASSAVAVAPASASPPAPSASVSAKPRAAQQPPPRPRPAAPAAPPPPAAQPDDPLDGRR